MVEIEPIPIIRLYDMLIVSIQKDLSDQLVIRLKDDITATIRSQGAEGLVIDVSGIGLMDSYITKAVNDIGKISGLMGVRTAIAGIDPMIAITLVEMGLNLDGVYTALNLETALETLVAQRQKVGLLGDQEHKDEKDDAGPGELSDEELLLGW